MIVVKRKVFFLRKKVNVCDFSMPCANGVRCVVYSGMGENKYTEMIWSHEKDEVK